MSGRVAISSILISAFVLGSAAHPATMSRADEPLGVLWTNPGDISKRDLFWGPGSAARRPKPPFTFIEENTGGTKPKVRVKDAGGVEWSVKFDNEPDVGLEVHAEVAASRIAWALGYFVEETYLVDGGVMKNVGALERARDYIGRDGRFGVARFERRSADVERRSEGWWLDNNPFTGTKELSGLLLLVSLLNNWDFREANTGIMRVRRDGQEQDRYLVSDWGTAFGRMTAGLTARGTRWNLEHYREDDEFILRADDRFVELYYRPDGQDRVRIPIAHARWFSALASGLTEAQLLRAFEAAQTPDEQARGFTARLMQKIAELRDAVAVPSR